MPKLIWLLRLFTKVWIAALSVLLAVSALATLMLRGWDEFAEIGSPHNFWGWMLVLAAYAPAHYAEKLAVKLEERIPLTKEMAIKIADSYSLVIKQKGHELPASKRRIGEALRLLSCDAKHEELRLFQLGAAYVSLANFHHKGAKEARNAEFSALCREWKSWIEYLWDSFGNPGGEFAESYPELAAEIAVSPWMPQKKYKDTA
ncbi:hypothetical protein [Cystobacter fuscus]|uniref:hypothetical protein n=1 Tax=Cystobacter fuscus TaxID=43 RepID=UPI0012DD06C6|nr:hypothetical protein [Cystobacter fuscus]